MMYTIIQIQPNNHDNATGSAYNIVYYKQGKINRGLKTVAVRKLSWILLKEIEDIKHSS